MPTKSNLIIRAFERAGISGLTVNASPEDIALGLNRLENMANRWAEKNICVGYNFEETPLPGSVHNIPRKYWDAFETSLMMRLLSAFGKEPTNALSRDASSSYSDLVSSTAVVPTIDYPSRHPLGSGNRFRGQFQNYYQPIQKAPIECATVKMAIGDVDDFYEDFAAYLNEGETIASYTLESDSGLDISNEVLDSPRVEYRVTATGLSETTQAVFQVKIVATTSSSRIETRIRNFELTDLDID